MSYPTKPCFVHYGGWDDETRKHPAMKWMEDYTINCIDARAFSLPSSAWHTADYTLHKADGTTISGGEPAWAGIAATYAPFTANLHAPSFFVCFDLPSEEGWEMMGEAAVYVNLPNPEKKEGKKVKDEQGREWDAVTPGGFRFVYVKDPSAEHHGIRLKSTRIFADSGPAMAVMLQRGLIKASDLGL